MKHLRQGLLITFLLFPLFLFPQGTDNRRQGTYYPFGDTLRLDSLSIVPGSLNINYGSGRVLDTSLYKVNYPGSYVVLDRAKVFAADPAEEGLKISYRVLPYNLSKTSARKDVALIRKEAGQQDKNPFAYSAEKTAPDIFKMEGLTKSGSLSRGVMFGNNQDVVVNSNLNLQLSGKLSNTMDISLVATDNNIPIQADGNTQQLQEFDKVYIQVSEKNAKLIAGDFQLANRDNYFMKFNKKARGISFSAVSAPDDKTKKGAWLLDLNGAVSKGKFARNQVQGRESNQGPYRLTGAENETFIVVLSGTEQVYIDGKLMKRGQDQDYVIDYNNAEITFTSRQLITKDKRIIVEFQYSDRNYARSLFHVGTGYDTKKLSLRINAYSEQDSKNQPLQQQLDAEQKKLLADAGDSLQLAVSPSADSVEFSNSEVLYAKIDTTVNSILYSGVFRYSTSPDSAHYRVRFSNVGQGKGNYRQTASAANGKVFLWVVPVAGIPQGDHEPVILLVSPKQKQMLSIGASYLLNANSKLSMESAVSNNNINTFSTKDKGDDQGFAGRFRFDNSFPLSGDTIAPWKLNTSVGYEYVQKNFAPVERFRSVEFERDWNRASSLQSEDQHIGSAMLALVKKTKARLAYSFNLFDEAEAYKAMKHGLSGDYRQKGFKADFDGSYLNSENPLTRTEFLRHRGGVSQRVGPFTIGAKEAQEQNLFKNVSDGMLGGASYGFFEWEGFISNADTSRNRYLVGYKERSDEAMKNNALSASTFARDLSFSTDLKLGKEQSLKGIITWRELSIRDTLLSGLKPDNTLVGRLEHNARFMKGAVVTSTFYEIGSGLEVKKEFSYIEVAAGQGIYAWSDFNNNGVQELNEFVVAAFPDQAKYIRVFTPTNNFIFEKTLTNQFSEVLYLKPAALWPSATGIKKAITLFSNQTAFRLDKKTTNTDPAVAYNPFAKQVMDTTLLSLNSSLRNTVYFNQNSPVFGIDYTWQDTRNKSSLINGFDSRTNTYHEVRGRWNVTRKWSTLLAYTNGRKLSNSQFFTSRNYQILYFAAEPKLSFQPNTSFRASLIFKYSEKRNSEEGGGQLAVMQDYGTEIKYNVLQKGSLLLQAHFIQIDYNDAVNTNLAYEMLDGLKIGQNMTWGLSYQRSIAGNMQISITYDGRRSEGVPVIHTGGAEVRAFF